MTIPPITSLPTPDRQPLTVSSPFKNLEQRYNDAVTRKDTPPLYDKAKKKFEGGQESTGRSDDPLLTRSPGDSQKGIKIEGREAPFVSAPSDNERLKKFLTGPKGIKFLLKQQLLQTGNTFAFTRIINPLFILGNATPYVHLRRNLRPMSVSQVAGSLGGLIGGRVGSAISFAGGIANSLGLGKITTDKDSLRKGALLQQETYDKLKSKIAYIPVIPSGGPASTNTPKFNLLKTVGGIVKKAITDSPIGKTISGLTVKRSMGELTSITDTDNNKLRPEMVNHVPAVLAAIKQYQNNLLIDPITGREAKEIRFLRYFTNTDPRSIYSISSEELNSSKTPYSVSRFFGNRYKVKNLGDHSNWAWPDQGRVSPEYKDLTVLRTQSPFEYRFDDPIKVSFAIGKESPIQFRAFIKELRQSAIPEYKAYQYIGRIEKFINFVGVQREIAFKLTVLAFSRIELDIVWKRINFLTGMVFPYGWNRGILQPNIVRLTIGSLFEDQPGYITSLNYNFDEISESWEIDPGRLGVGRAQVPIGATMDIKFALIEKKTKISTSPFYGITEGKPEFGGRGSDQSQQPPGELPPVSMEDVARKIQRLNDYGIPLNWETDDPFEKRRNP